ncbi:MFS transporter [Chloroflexota bacterium]
MAEKKKPGFFYGYIVLMAAFSIKTLAYGSNRSFGVFLVPMLAEFGWTRAGISTAFTLGMIVMGLMSLVAGRLTDRIGPRLVLLVSGFFLGTGYLLVSQISDIWQFYVFYGMMTGIGMSGCGAPLFSIIARWFFRRRSLMSGILFVGPALGITAIPLLSSLLISACGWRTSYLILGSVVLVGTMTAALFLRRDPGGMGLKPYGLDKTEAQGRDVQVQGFSPLEALRTRQFWLLAVLSFANFFLINIIVVHIVVHATGMGISATIAASILSVSAGVSIPGRIIAGAFADRVGNKRALLVYYILGLVAFLLLLVARDVWMFYVVAAVFGVGFWASFSLLSPITAELFGLKAHGTIFACTMVATTLGGAVGPVLAGRIFDVTGSYQPAFIICILVTIVAIVSTIFLRPTHRL